MRLRTISLSLAALAAAFCSAQTVTKESFDNATVQPGGPRSGGNGKHFFNVQGSDNGNFASFGVADFLYEQADFPDTVTGINSVSFQLISSLAGFSQESGPINVYLVENTTQGIQPGDSIFFDAAMLPEGVGAQLGTKHFMGTFNFRGLIDGGQNGDTYTVMADSLSDSAKNYLISQLNMRATVRVLVAPNNAAGDGSFAGFSNNTYDGPLLTIDATSGSNVTVSGQITFTGYIGPSIGSVMVDYKDSFFNTVFTTNATVDGSGNYTAAVPPTPGNYYVSIKPRTFLRRTVGQIDTSSSQTGVNLVLINGDVVENNEVDLTDYNALAAAFGSILGDPNFNPRADLNGDDEVSLGDYTILAGSFGQIGDD